MSTKRRWILALSVFLGICLVGPQAAFAKKDKDLDKVLGDIEWGDTKTVVLKKMKKRLMKEARKDKSIKQDPVLLQKKRKEIVDDIKEAEESYTRLQGERTGYEVSVIADEYTTNNGESFIRIKDRVAQRFFFFMNGKFYKLVVSYSPSYLRDVGFEAFVATSVKKYGRPAVAEYDTIRGEEQLALVQWKSPTTILTVKNKKELFDTYTMAFADRQTVKRLRASKKNFGGSDKSEEELSATVKSLTEYGDHRKGERVVDGIVGGTDIDLNKGRPKDDQVRRYDEDGDVVKKKKAKKKKKKKPKKKKKRKKKKSPDFSDIETKSDDDLIIY